MNNENPSRHKSCLHKQGVQKITHLNPIWGVKPPLPKNSSKTHKMASKYPQISWLILFLYDLSEKQKFFLVFHSDFGCLEGGG